MLTEERIRRILDLLDEQVKSSAKRREMEQQLSEINAMIRSGALRFVEDETYGEDEQAEGKTGSEDGEAHEEA